MDDELDAAIRLRSSISRLSRRLRPTQVATGLTPTQLSALVSTVLSGPLGLSELAEREGLNPTMLSRIVGQLAERGLLRRSAHPDDRRAARVEATAAGRRLHERMRQEKNDALVAQLALLTPDEHD